MNTEKMQLSLLVPAEKNVRIHSKKQIAEFVRSLEMFGQIRPIVVDENYKILCGNGMYEALIAMSRTEADVLMVKNLSASKKKKLMIADNKIYNLGIDDIGTLNEFFVELKDDLDIPGFDEDILKSMIEDAEEVTERIADYGIIPDEEIINMKNNAEKQTTMSQDANGTQQNNTPTVIQKESDTNKSADSVNVDKCIVCPHCGEKIWL